MKIAVKYGLIIAVVYALVNSFFLDLFGLEYAFVRKYSGFAPFVIMGTGLFVAMKKTKEVEYANDLNYGQAIYSGIVISSFIALFCAVFNFLYFQFINPDYYLEVIRITTPMMVADKLPPNEIAALTKEIKEVTYKPINQLTTTFVVLLLCGIVFSAIFSAFLRTKDTFSLKPKDQE